MERLGLPGSDGRGWCRWTCRGVAVVTESESRLLEVVRPKETILRNQSKTSQVDGCMERVQEKQRLVRGHLHWGSVGLPTSHLLAFPWHPSILPLLWPHLLPEAVLSFPGGENYSSWLLPPQGVSHSLIVGRLLQTLSSCSGEAVAASVPGVVSAHYTQSVPVGGPAWHGGAAEEQVAALSSLRKDPRLSQLGRLLSPLKAVRANSKARARWKWAETWTEVRRRQTLSWSGGFSVKGAGAAAIGCSFIHF